jgi:DeoR/GlpR family transcriptional regulator of sugar metabolism
MRLDERAVRMMRLLEYLNEQERPVPVSDLGELATREFGVSEVTLRSDLAALCSLRSVRKLGRGTYKAGPAEDRDAPGASLPGSSLFSTRLRLRAESKIAIAGAVVRHLVRQPDLRVLLLDAGSTTYFVADRLSEVAGLDLIVWTPSVAAASRLAGSRGVSVRLLGGEYHPDYAVVSGDETARALRALAGPEGDAAGLDAPLPQFAGTHCVLDLNYVSEDGRLYTDESKERLQKRLMADLSEELTLVADHSKLFGRRLGLQAHEINALAQFSGKRAVRLVTDCGASAAQMEAARHLMERAFPGWETTLEEDREALVFTSKNPDA